MVRCELSGEANSIFAIALPSTPSQATTYPYQNININYSDEIVLRCPRCTASGCASAAVTCSCSTRASVTSDLDTGLEDAMDSLSLSDARSWVRHSQQRVDDSD